MCQIIYVETGSIMVVCFLMDGNIYKNINKTVVHNLYVTSHFLFLLAIQK